MESKICKIYAQFDEAGRQLPVTEFAHKPKIVGILRRTTWKRALGAQATGPISRNQHGNQPMSTTRTVWLDLLALPPRRSKHVISRAQRKSNILVIFTDDSRHRHL
jgi:hypothetical protein